ncbi:unnamed protein product [Heligmosomoides polygyrus]|uniref:Uncharacterized protein n=1 Tax=Heligmosomoides polygyrus TaxID=6339 RepID=A0A183FDQ5_HELPZ|nr:unnamed protein product [Heligmosomoides polygyrus]
MIPGRVLYLKDLFRLLNNGRLRKFSETSELKPRRRITQVYDVFSEQRVRTSFNVRRDSEDVPKTSFNVRRDSEDVQKTSSNVRRDSEDVPKTSSNVHDEP